MQLWVSEYCRRSSISFKANGTLHSEKSMFQKIDVVDTIPFGRMLFLDGVVMLSDRDECIYHEMISHIPLLAHPNPKNVLIIGGGDGGTVREVLKHESVESITLCEIDDAVIDVCKKFFPNLTAQLDHEKVTIKIADGVQYMAQEAQGYDIIIIDSTDGGIPMDTDEVGQQTTIDTPLFTKEFYHNAYNALNQDGILVAQTNSPYTGPELMHSIYSTLPEIFPIVKMYHANIPTFLHGLCTWAFCSKRPTSDIKPENIENGQKIEATCHFYNSALHQASFILPNFLHHFLSN